MGVKVVTTRIRSASIAGEWGLSRRASSMVESSLPIHGLLVEVNISKLLQLGESLRHSVGERIMRSEINAWVPSLCIGNHEVDGLLQQLNSVGLTTTTTSGHITPLFKQADLYKVASEIWESQATDFEKYVVDKSVEASKSFVELDASSRNDDMLMRLNENLKFLHVTKEKDVTLAVSSRYIIRSRNAIFKTIKPPEGIDARVLKQCLKDMDNNICLRHDVLMAILNQRVGDKNKTLHLVDWLRDLGLIIPHTVQMGAANFFYSFPLRVIDTNNIDSEKIAPNVRDIISHFQYASEFSTVRYPGLLVGALATGRRVGPAMDIPSKYGSLISKGLVKVENKQMVAIDRESFQRAETLMMGGENIDFSKMDVKIPEIPPGSMQFGEAQTKILLDAAKKGGLYTL